MVSKKSVEVLIIIAVMVSVVFGIAVHRYQAQQSPQDQEPYYSQGQDLPQRGRQRMPRENVPHESANNTVIENVELSFFF